MQDSIQDSTRYVVSDLHYGSIMPGNRMEMMRDVFLIEKAKIEGGIYSNNLVLEGNTISIAKSVYARKSITIKEKNNNTKIKCNEFSSTVVAADSILSEAANTKLRFKSDIYTDKLNVSNAIVFGNVFANHAIIRNSIVLGGIFVKNKLDISDSIFSTFRVKETVLGKNLFMFFPVALSELKIDVKYPICAISFFNISKNIDKKINSGIIKLDNDDVFEVDENYWDDQKGDVDNKNQDEKSYQQKMFCLSIVERILDSKAIIEHFKFNKDFLESLMLSAHYSEDENQQKHEKPIEELENWLWDILNSKEKFENLTGSSNIKDLFSRFENDNNRKKPH